MNNKMYLIHEDDYIKHIDEKVFLYSLVKQLTHHIARLAPNRGSKKISDMAKCYDSTAEKLFRSWGIPVSYLVFDNKDDLATLIENELIAPEDAGYYSYDDECDFFPCNCGCCCEAGDEYAEDDEDKDEYIAEMMAELSSFIHSIFGENVSVHIAIE